MDTGSACPLGDAGDRAGRRGRLGAEPLHARRRLFRAQAPGPRQLRGKSGDGYRASAPNAGKVGPGDSARRIRSKTKRFGKAYRIRRVGSRRIVYRVRKGKIRYVAVATKSVAKSPKRLRAYLRLAGLR